MRIVVARGSLAGLIQAQARWSPEVSFVEADVNSTEQIASATADADGIVVALQRLGAADIAALGSGVRVIGRAGVGLDAIDLPAARARGIAVINQPSYATAEVATHAVAMILTMQRLLVKADAVVRGGWGVAAEVGVIEPLDEATVGVVGAGKIGRAVMDRVRPFAARVLTYDPASAGPIPGVTAVASLRELLELSDVVTLHLPLLPATRHLINTDSVRRMKPGALLVNVSRGGLVDEDAVAAALHDGHLGGAALDVFEVEPPAADSQIMHAPRVLLSPHLAWYSTASARRLSTWTADDVVKHLMGDSMLSGAVANA